MIREFLNGQIIVECSEKGIWRITSVYPREICGYCGSESCCFQCDGSQAADDEENPESEVVARLKINGALNGIESMLLALLRVDILDSYILDNILQEVIDATANND